MNATNREEAATAQANGAGTVGDEVARGLGSPRRKLSEEEVRLIRSTLMSPRDRTPSDEEVALFRRQIERTGLDPFARQIYVVYRYNRRRRREEMSIETTIDGLRLIAERTGRYEGQTRARWCGEDGKWRESWADSEPPVAATVGVFKHGAREPTWGTAHFCEYAEFWEDTGRAKGFYGTMPRNQLAIRAEAQALRKAFPAELSGLYAAEEIVDRDGETPVEAGVSAVAASAAPPAEAATVDGGPPDQEMTDGVTASGGGMRAVEPRAPSGAPAQLRWALRERADEAGLDAEATGKLSAFYFGQPRVDRLGEEQVRELIKLVGLVGAAGISAGTLKGQITKAEGQADRDEARVVISRWMLRRANEAAGKGEPGAAAEATAQTPPADGDGKDAA